MKPKTVGRVKGGSSPHKNAHMMQLGIVAGTLVLTADGEIPVEYLSAGDRIISRTTGFVRLKKIGAKRVITDAVAMKPSALGNARPRHTMLLPNAQKIMIRDWRAEAMFGKKQAIATAGQLIDGEFVLDLGKRPLQLFELTFDEANIIYCDGLEILMSEHKAAQSQAA